MRVFLSVSLAVSIALNAYLSFRLFSQDPPFRLKTVSSINGDRLDLEDFELLNDESLVSAQGGCAVAPIRNGWMILVAQGESSDQAVTEVIESVEVRIDKRLEEKRVSSER